MEKSVKFSNLSKKYSQPNKSFKSNHCSNKNNVFILYFIKKMLTTFLKITKRAFYALSVFLCLLASEMANLIEAALTKTRNFYLLVATPDEETLDQFSRHLWRVEIQRLSDLFDRRTVLINEMRLRSSGSYRLTEERISRFENIESRDKEAEMQCVVCLNDFGVGKVLIKLDCDHSFCAACIRGWFEIKTSCPVCRRKFYNVDLD